MTVLAAALEADALVIELAALVDRAVTPRPLPGAADLLAALDQRRWAVVGHGEPEETAAVLRAAGLPAPEVLIGTDAAGRRTAYGQPAARLGTTAERLLVVVGTPDAVRDARAVDARVLACASVHAADELEGAQMVVAGLDDLVVRLTERGVRLRVVGGSPSRMLAATVRELAAMAQTGLEFATDAHDRDRYRRLRAVAAHLGAGAVGWDEAALRGLLDADLGYATPKVDVRGLARDERGRVLLVRERSDGRWTLPGGWADTTDLPSEAIAREVREEAGWRVEVTRLLACWDRTFQADAAPLPHRVYKLCFACHPVRRTVGDDRETDAVAWFAADDLPPLSLGRVTPEQIGRLVALDDDPSAPAAFH